jgi:hypothetical protein
MGFIDCSRLWCLKHFSCGTFKLDVIGIHVTIKHQAMVMVMVMVTAGVQKWHVSGPSSSVDQPHAVFSADTGPQWLNFPIDEITCK